jgi:hypothetical protein
MDDWPVRSIKNFKKTENEVITAVNPTLRRTHLQASFQLKGPCAAAPHVSRWNLPQTSYHIERLTTKSAL